MGPEPTMTTSLSCIPLEIISQSSAFRKTAAFLSESISKRVWGIEPVAMISLS